MNRCCSSSSSSSSSSPSQPSPPAAVTDESDSAHSSLLLPNLPDDLALECIARVPRLYHSDLSLVSKSWRSMIRSQLFFSTRNRLKCTQHFLYFGVDFHDSYKWFSFNLNPKSPRSLSPVPPVPSQAINSAFVVLGPRIYALGGSVRGTLSSDVWIFDSRFNRWEIGPKMSVERVYPAAGILNGKIYVMGGCDSKTTNWAEVFDPALGSWATVPSPVEFRIGRATSRSNVIKWYKTAVVEDKFYVVFCDDGEEGFVFDPYDLSWHYLPTKLHSGWTMQACGGTMRACGVGGILYSCCHCGRRIRGFDVKEGTWKELKGLQKDLSDSFYQIAMVNVEGRLCGLWEEYNWGTQQMDIYCAEVEIRKDSNGGLWGSVVSSQLILVVPLFPFLTYENDPWLPMPSVSDCLVVEF